MGSYPSSKEVGDVLLIKVKRNRKGEERWEINMQWICLRKKKFIKAQVLHTIFHNEENLYSVVSMKVIETNETYDEKSDDKRSFSPHA